MKITRDEYAKSYVIEVEGEFYYWNPPIESRLNQKDGAIEAAPSQESYLNAGTRYKVGEYCGNGAILCLPPDMVGQWVALVDATDNCHIKAAPSQKPVVKVDHNMPSGLVWLDRHAPMLPHGTPLYPHPAPSQEPVAVRFPQALRKMWSGGEVQAWLDREGPFYTTPPNAAAQVESLKAQLEGAKVMYEAMSYKADTAAAQIAETECEANVLRGQLAEAQAVLRQAREALEKTQRYGINASTFQTLAAIDAVLSGAPVDTTEVEFSVDHDHDGDLAIDMHRGKDVISICVSKVQVHWAWHMVGHGTAPIPAPVKEERR